MEQHTIACAYRPGNGFTEVYVRRLRESLLLHCKAPHRFVCMTNEQLPGVECVKPRGNNRGWWVKLHLFSAFEKAVYFDLDTMVVGDITDIVEYPHSFTGLSDFSAKRSSQFASGFMAWDGNYSYLDQDIDAQTEREYDAFVTRNWQKHGDQGWLAEKLRRVPDLTSDLFPGRFRSFKWDVRRQGRVPEGASVICFHGLPRPHSIGWRLP